jgi:choline dehydrogenase-like flavoprotein
VTGHLPCHQCRFPVLPAARAFVEAAVAAGITHGDYNGRDRGGAAGVVSLGQSTTRRGKRSSTYQAFLEGEPERRPNLTIITGAPATRVIIEGAAGHTTASDVEYRTASGEKHTAYERSSYGAAVLSRARCRGDHE